MESGKCPQCGNELVENDKVCLKCGYVLIEATQNNTLSNDDKSAFSNNSNSVFVFNGENKPKKKFEQGLIIGGIVGLSVGLILGSVLMNAVKSTKSIIEGKKQEEASSSIGKADDEDLNKSAKEVDAGKTNNTSAEDSEKQNTQDEISSTQSLDNKSDVVSAEGALLSYLGCDTSVFETSEIWGEGFYKCGTDIEAGEYVYSSEVGWGGTVVYADASRSNVITNLYGIFNKFTLEEGEYVDVGYGGVVVPYDIINQNDLSKYGIYECGKDIPAGEYKAVTLSSDYKSKELNVTGVTGTFEVHDSMFDGACIQQDNIRGPHSYISLKEGQLLYLRNVTVLYAD